MSLPNTVVATHYTRNMPLLTELGWCSGGSSAITMALLTELSRSPIPLKTAKKLFRQPKCLNGKQFQRRAAWIETSCLW
jgi:hypothetical protein